MRLRFWLRLFLVGEAAEEAAVRVLRVRRGIPASLVLRAFREYRVFRESPAKMERPERKEIQARQERLDLMKFQRAQIRLSLG
jgi:hypothetical protein